MPIVQEIIQTLGGTIDVESEKGKGTTFTINLCYPLCLEKPFFPDLTGKRILIADDSPISSEILKEFVLAAHGIPETANDGRQVFDAFSNSTQGYYDLILMDMRMPDLSGDETAKMIRSLSRTDAKTIPIIAQSACGLEEDEKKEFLSELGLPESGLDRLVKKSYKLLGLISYLTAGQQEVRAWTIVKGTKAPQAAGKIHSDFEKGFIRAEIVAYNDLIRCGTYAIAREKGLVRSEGKEYVMQDGDVTLFRFNV
jgi:CheY-like chemotaxis protein